MIPIKQKGEYLVVLKDVEGNPVEVKGKFNTTFAAIIEKLAGTKNLMETLRYCQTDFGINKIAEMLYCSNQAFCDTYKEESPTLNSVSETINLMDSFGLPELEEMLNAFGEATILGNKMNFGIERSTGEKEEKTTSKAKKK